VAILIGANAPVVLEPVRATCASDQWDFFKPLRRQHPYPEFNGPESLKCYEASVRACGNTLRDKLQRRADRENQERG
jgi:3-hydroxy-3-methylglutaryl CoA synthase